MKFDLKQLIGGIVEFIVLISIFILFFIMIFHKVLEIKTSFYDNNYLLKTYK